jgi:hypothetical protein
MEFNKLRDVRACTLQASAEYPPDFSQTTVTTDLICDIFSYRTTVNILNVILQTSGCHLKQSFDCPLQASVQNILQISTVKELTVTTDLICAVFSYRIIHVKWNSTNLGMSGLALCKLVQNILQISIRQLSQQMIYDVLSYRTTVNILNVI